MPISAGDAVWTIRGDLSKLNKALDEGAANVKGASAKILKNSRAVGIGITAMGASVTAGVLAAVSSFAKYGDEIGKMAQRTGFSTQAISVWRHAAEQTGTSIESVEKAIKKASVSILNFDIEQKKAAESGKLATGTYSTMFSVLGLSVEQLKGAAPEEAFAVIAQALQKVPDEMERLALAQQVLGRSGADLLPLIMQGKEGLAAYGAEAGKLGLILEDTKSQEAFTDNMDEMRKSFQGLINNLVPVLLPALVSLIEFITALVVKVTEWSKNNTGLAKTVAIVGAALGGIASIIGPVLIVLPGLITAFGVVAKAAIKIKPAIMGLSGPFGWITGAVILLTVAIVKNWDTIKSASKAMWDFVVRGFDWLLGKIKSIIGSIKKMLGGGIFGSIKDFVSGGISGAVSLGQAGVDMVTGGGDNMSGSTTPQSVSANVNFNAPVNVNSSSQIHELAETMGARLQADLRAVGVGI